MQHDESGAARLPRGVDGASLGAQGDVATPRTFAEKHAQIDPDPLVELKRRMQLWADVTVQAAIVEMTTMRGIARAFVAPYAHLDDAYLSEIAAQDDTIRFGALTVTTHVARTVLALRSVLAQSPAPLSPHSDTAQQHPKDAP